MNAVTFGREFGGRFAGTTNPHQRASDDATREIRLGWTLIILFFGVALGWACFARLDAAAYASGAVAVAGHRQSVQHKDGGIVSHINVREGSLVSSGQVLINLAPIEIEAAEQAMSAQIIGLQAERARLHAEQTGAADIVWPRELTVLSGPGHDEAVNAMALQRSELNARRSAITGQKRVLEQRGSQLREAIGGYRKEIGTTSEQERLIDQELTGLKTLAARGFASMNRVRELQRVAAGLEGQSGELSANAARSQAQIGETHMQALSLDSDRMEDVTKSLRDVNFQLGDLLPKLQAIHDQLSHMQIRAPSSGRVVGLTIFTVGGVIAPGQRLLDIVPQHRPIVVEARLAPDDTDGVHVGQRAELKITAIRDRSLPIIEGRITRISADALTDERTGQQFFTIEVSVPDAEAARVRALRGPNGGLRTGQPAQVVIPLRRRTAITYLLEPLLGAFWSSLHER